MYQLDQEIDGVEAELRTLKRKRAKLETRLLNDFDKSDIEGAKGAFGIAGIRRTRHPQLKDPKAFWKYVFAKRAADLLHRRISSKAYFDRLEEGETVPGVEIYTSIGVSIRKRKS